MDSPKNETQMKKEKENMPSIAILNEKKVDQAMFLQIEILIQQQYQVLVPALVFEYRPTSNTVREFSGWDYEDLAEFFTHFGDIELLEIYGKVAIILFKTFIDAYTSKEFLQNTSNYKDTEKDNFVIRWYTAEDETYLSELMKSKLKKYTPNQIVENVQTSNKNGWGQGQNQNNNYRDRKENQFGYNYNINYNNYQDYSKNNTGGQGNTGEYPTPNFNDQYNYYASMCLTPKAREEFSGIMNTSTQSQGSSNSYQSTNYYPYDEDSKSQVGNDKYLVNGKYTCKFEIQIENDNEFQVARRLIGAKVIFFGFFWIFSIFLIF
jgi:hypothetical protein